MAKPRKKKKIAQNILTLMAEDQGMKKNEQQEVQLQQEEEVQQEDEKTPQQQEEGKEEEEDSVPKQDGCCARLAAAYRTLFPTVPRYKPVKDWDKVFDALNLHRREVQKFWWFFWNMDKDKSGKITVLEFLMYLDIERSKFNVKAFSICDLDESGEIDFLEFVVSVWNFCTLGKRNFTFFTFDLYDLDGNGTIGFKEMEQMCKGLYGASWRKSRLAIQVMDQLENLGIECGGEVSGARFANFSKTHPTLLFPAFHLQRQLQTRILGYGFWEQAAFIRENMASNRKFADQREVYSIIRNYKTAAAAAVLTHTGDPRAALHKIVTEREDEDEDEDALLDFDDEEASDKVTTRRGRSCFCCCRRRRRPHRGDAAIASASAAVADGTRGQQSSEGESDGNASPAPAAAAPAAAVAEKIKPEQEPHEERPDEETDVDKPRRRRTNPRTGKPETEEERVHRKHKGGPRRNRAPPIATPNRLPPLGGAKLPKLSNLPGAKIHPGARLRAESIDHARLQAETEELLRTMPDGRTAPLIRG